MTALEQRIARVLVRAHHPELTDAKIDLLVDLGVGAATARAVIAELELEQQPERCPQCDSEVRTFRRAACFTRRHIWHDTARFDDRCTSTYAGWRCARQAGHGDSHCEDVTPGGCSFVWTESAAAG